MDLDTKKVYLLLGSNLGERKAIMDNAVRRIRERIGTLVAKSAYYETAPWGRTDQPAFLNLALCILTSRSALDVLEEALSIEQSLGRVRDERWGARLIDIDILLYGEEMVDIEGKLKIPHPEMHNRRFALEPLAEIAGEVNHPILNLTISEILDSLPDNLRVSKI